jgi:hypothetical protein
LTDDTKAYLFQIKWKDEKSLIDSKEATGENQTWMVAEKRRGGLYDQAVVLNEARFVLVSC